jgi:hypothetical protein
MKFNKRLYTLTTTLLLTSLLGQIVAQTATNSPYSRYGIGDINAKGFSNNAAMGGSTIALQNDSLPIFFINNGNPASYTSNTLTSIDLGLKVNNTTFATSSSKKNSTSGSIGNIALAFPIKKWWGTSIGLLPYSSVGYNVSDQQNITNIGDVTFLYQGKGGVNQIYWGNAIKPFYGLPNLYLKSKKHETLSLNRNDSTIARTLHRKQAWQGLSIGANVSYMTGDIQHTQSSVFPSSGLLFNTRTGTSVHVSDIYVDYGVQYAYTIRSWKGQPLAEKVQILAGANFSNQANINATVDTLSYSYFTNVLGYEVVKDTIRNIENTKGSITLPLSFGFGLGFRKGTRWLATSDFKIQNWSNFNFFNQSQNLKNSLRVSGGVQYTPNYSANGKGDYLKRVNYRAGLRYSQTMIELKNTQLTEKAFTCGLGLPVGRSFVLRTFSMINIGFEFGQRGNINNGLVKENFFNTSIGFTINEMWFQKQKYD